MNPGEREEIRRKIAEGGFGAELKARRFFAEAGFHTTAFDYLDKDELKTREVDILAEERNANRFSELPRFFHFIVAEVKSHHIWVAGDDNRSSAEPSVIRYSVPSWFTAERPASSGESFGLHSDYLEGFRLRATTNATSFFQVKEKEDKRDALYEACTSVVKGIEGLQRPQAMSPTGRLGESPHIYVIVPLVILDGNLLGVTYRQDGQFELEPREHVQRTFSFGTPNYTRKETSIHVVTLDYLPTFLQKVVTSEQEATDLTGRMYQRLHPPLG